MIPSPPTEQALRELALQSFLDSLGKAEKHVSDSQQSVYEKERELRDAVKQLQDSEDVVTAYKALITRYSTDADSKLVPSVQNPVDTHEDDEEDNDKEQDGEVEDSLKPRRKRLNAAPTLLELITKGGLFKTADQLVGMLHDEYGDLIKEKTSKNAVWSLNADGSIKKYYSKEHVAYIYGLPSWFSNDKPMPEHLERGQTFLEALGDFTAKTKESLNAPEEEHENLVDMASN